MGQVGLVQGFKVGSSQVGSQDPKFGSHLVCQANTRLIYSKKCVKSIFLDFDAQSKKLCIQWFCTFWYWDQMGPNLKHFSRLIHLLKQQNLEFLRTKLDAVWKRLVPSLTLSGLWNQAELFQGTLEVLIRNEWHHQGSFYSGCNSGRNFWRILSPSSSLKYSDQRC